jgi:hypothetical protein
MRDQEVSDSELRPPAAVRRSIREQGGEPSSHGLDELLINGVAQRRHRRVPSDDAAGAAIDGLTGALGPTASLLLAR